MTLAAAVLSAIQATVPIMNISLGDINNRTTWLVTPNTLQAQAQPIIDAFNPSDPALVTADLNAAVTDALDNQRLISAVVWTIIDQLAAPATITKYNAARTKIIAAYKAQPWKP